MKFEYSEIEEAYIKLKSYIYFDNTDLLLRRRLVEFESNLTKQGLNTSFGAQQRNPYVGIQKTLDDDVAESVKAKLDVITDKLNKHHIDPGFFNTLLENIAVQFYPKTVTSPRLDVNYVSNKRVFDDYSVERITCFLDAPIELHIISVLWILRRGVEFDTQLSNNALGNRLLLNKERTKVVKGSGLFKPYFKQYQQWRDSSVKVAQDAFDNDNDVLFLNLDIKDYFHSVRFNTRELLGTVYETKSAQPLNSLNLIFLEIHISYTKLVANNYAVPYQFYADLEKDATGNLTQTVLPIGLLSSFVLANSYLREFDDRIIQRIKPAYYGRYVDDLILVITNPKADYYDEEKLPSLQFNFEEYKTEINSDISKGEKNRVSFTESELTNLEKYILKSFRPVLKLVDAPFHIAENNEAGVSEKNRAFTLAGYPSLYCQSSKSLIYYFDHYESDLVLDKLKKELEERTSEFRDFPDDKHNEETFEENAYHLFYDGTEGKIATLKDYKENRFGLTIYLANKIFSALRHERKVSDDESLQVLKFFRGFNCLTFYRLWERIFTFFLVNEQAELYVKFYLHCVSEIEKLQINHSLLKVSDKELHNSLLEYLDCSHEIVLALNPNFIARVKKAKRNFEFQISAIQSKGYLEWLSFEPTLPKTFWGQRFRRTNMIRHHYCIHPLLTYTKAGANSKLNLTSLNLDVTAYTFDNRLITRSPRPVKYWECCLAIIYSELNKFKDRKIPLSGYLSVDILGLKKVKLEDEESGTREEYDFYLEDAYRLYKQLNSCHVPSYTFEEDDHIRQFYTRSVDPIIYDNSSPTQIQEISVNPSLHLSSPRLSFANTEVSEDNIQASLRGKPNLSFERYQQLSSLLKMVRQDSTDILLFPEFFLPVSLLASLVRYSEKNQMLTITGLEHITVNRTCFNYIVTILPFESDGIKDAVVVFRLKNHYAHIEETLIDGNHCVIPKPDPYRYDLFVWKNIYFSSFYCFELANALHRSLMKGKIDLLIGIEWNRDTPYFSNIVEAGTRDLHVYVAQANTSQFGDTRLTQPVESARKDILRLKGGKNDTILTETINLPLLRDFQRQKFALTHHLKTFKPLPPDFPVRDVLRRIQNMSVIDVGNRKL